jgi:hypothetical protein
LITIIKVPGANYPELRGNMARKKGKKRFDVVKAVKAAARAAVGTPPPTRRVEATPKRRATKQEKHKTTLSNLLGEE